MGSSGSSVAKSHLRLAEGLIGTVKISDAGSEYELRNALSRSYYALYHACRGYLWASGLGLSRIKHGRLQAEMERRMGRWFGQFLETARDLRRNSDYEPGWTVPPLYACLKELKSARGHYYFVTRNAKNLISQSQG